MPSVSRFVPHSFQARLTGAFVAIVAVTVALVAVLVINREGAYFDQQQRDDLTARARGVAQYVANVAEATTFSPIVTSFDVANLAVLTELSRTSQQRILADRLAQADVHIRLGRMVGDDFVPASNGDLVARQSEEPQAGQLREPITSDPLIVPRSGPLVPYAI